MGDVGVARSGLVRRRYASALPLLLTVPLLWGCSGADGATAEAAEPGWQDLDACRVIDREDVHEVVGTIVRDGDLTVESDGASRCVWMAELGPPSATLFVALEPDSPAPRPDSLRSDLDPDGLEFIDDLGSAAVWRRELSDLRVWAFGQQLQLGNPGITKAEAVELARRALTQMRGG